MVDLSHPAGRICSAVSELTLFGENLEDLSELDKFGNIWRQYKFGSSESLGDLIQPPHSDMNSNASDNDFDRVKDLGKSFVCYFESCSELE